MTDSNLSNWTDDVMPIGVIIYCFIYLSVWSTGEPIKTGSKRKSLQREIPKFKTCGVDSNTVSNN